DLAFGDLEADAANRLDRAVALPELVHAQGRVRVPARRHGRGDSAGGAGHRFRAAGHTLPSTRISPSAGIPGLAKPTAPRSPSFTPTTCFTRSSRKYVSSGVNEACGSMRRRYASMGVAGAESRYTRAGWPTRTRPIWPSGTKPRRYTSSRFTSEMI